MMNAVSVSWAIAAVVPERVLELGKPGDVGVGGPGPDAGDQHQSGRDRGPPCVVLRPRRVPLVAVINPEGRRSSSSSAEPRDSLDQGPETFRTARPDVG